MFVFGLETEIFLIVYCLIVHLAFVTSHNLLFSSLYKTSKKHFRFSVVFYRKTVQILIFKVEYLENASADFNDFGPIFQDFERPFNLFRRCSSLLRLPFLPFTTYLDLQSIGLVAYRCFFYKQSAENHRIFPFRTL